MRCFIKIACLFISLMFLPLYAFSGLQQSIDTIERLLARGKKVAVLVIDMDILHASLFRGDWGKQILEAQSELLAHFAERNGIMYVDVTFEARTPVLLPLRDTVPELALKMKRNILYSRFLKKGGNAFEYPSAVTNYEQLKEVVHGKLAPYLRERNVTDIFAMGCYDDLCVRNTVRGALKDTEPYRFKVHVDRDLNIPAVPREDTPKSATKTKQMADDGWGDVKREYQDIDIISSKRPKTNCTL